MTATEYMRVRIRTMQQLSAAILLLLIGSAALLPLCQAFTPLPAIKALSFQKHPRSPLTIRSLAEESNKNHDTPMSSTSPTPVQDVLQKTLLSTALALTIGVSAWTQFPSITFAATDPGAIVGCLVQKCRLELGKCILNPKCLANVACINTCNGRPDEIECQIQCGNLFENDVVGEFNKCAVSDMDCVPQQKDDGSYPVPSKSQVVDKFSTNLFNGRWYISAGQNPLFDTFPCQVHFFSENGPNKFIGKLNWRIEEPDGEFFTRDALQAFVQDPDMPAHLLNHDNEYLHYQDDWWIIDYEYDNNPSGTPPFAFVYYRGSNDAWDGYGGVVVYTRDAAFPKSLLPRMREAAKKVGYDFDKDFKLTDNSCPTELTEGEKVVLREKFAGNAFLQTEKQLQAQAVRVRGNAVNSIKAQKIFFSNEFEATEQAFKKLEEKTKEFEEEVVKEAEEIIEEVVKDAEEAVTGGSSKNLDAPVAFTGKIR